MPSVQHTMLSGRKIARISTVPQFMLAHLPFQLKAIKNTGADLTLVSSKTEDARLLQEKLDFNQFKPIFIARKISLQADLRALIQLTKLFRVERYTLVHSTTPKAGLLTALAGKFAGLPLRIHTFTGQPWATARGFKRFLLKACDRLVCRLNTQVYADSLSQAQFLIDQRIAKPGNIMVLGAGSIAGINTERFNSSLFSKQEKNALKKQYGIPEDAPICLFIGRITAEKGIFDLLEAFTRLNHPTSVLLVVGAFEKDTETRARTLAGPSVIFTGFSAEPERFIAIADLLCLPSYREGFPAVVLEAAAMNVPTVATRIYGLTDAVVDGVTGLLVEPKNTTQLTDALRKLLTTPKERQRLGSQAKARVLKEFDSRHHAKLLLDEYARLIQAITTPN